MRLCDWVARLACQGARDLEAWRIALADGAKHQYVWSVCLSTRVTQGAAAPATHRRFALSGAVPAGVGRCSRAAEHRSCRSLSGIAQAGPQSPPPVLFPRPMSGMGHASGWLACRGTGCLTRVDPTGGFFSRASIRCAHDSAPCPCV